MSSSEPGTALILWQGFHHRWGYNHRLNRLGSWVDAATSAQGCSGQIGHSAASGTGPDTAHFTSYYARVVESGVSVAFGKTVLGLAGQQGELIYRSERVQPADLPGAARLVVMCNGFDLVSQDRACKLMELFVRIGEPVREGGGLAFDLEIRFRAACTSGECPPPGHGVFYSLTVFWAVLGGATDALAVTTGSYGRDCTWTEGDARIAWTPESEALLHGDRPYLAAAPGIQAQAAVVAFQEIEVRMAGDYHMLALDLAAHDLSWNPGQGASFDLDLRFVQWVDGMKTVRPIWSLASFRQAGSGVVRAGMALIQFAAASVGPRSVEGQIFWPGEGASAVTDAAVSRFSESVTAGG